MATTTVIDLIKRAKIILQDTTGTRWPDSELLGWFNDAQLAVVNRRPDALVSNDSFTCAEGAKQALPSDALRLIKIVRNLTTGTSIRAIRGEILDDQIPDWYSQEPTTEVKHYVFDPRDPKTFYVYPPATATVSLELAYTVAPAAVAIADFENDATTITLDDSFKNALLDFMLYRAYSKDADYAANGQRAVSHYQAFETALGAKYEPDAAMNPTPLPTGNTSIG
ncbi:hypothetical protein KUW19_00835 [Ferrimonas balearica]|uniref:phage adaptor protein n=1 Tax=Ferrimonas balearica TaxID=44012 RepID=UPI001C98D381|nr:DUF6682 family protein [Ferrimonas balearica]MBY6105022.1 hypothetical protein [Ferrimonas balearica]